MLLAIDTSEQTCSAALVLANKALTHRSENIGRGHAERLLPLIDELLAEKGASYKDISRLAVTTGPGTFTGLRVGLSVARGFALVNQVPCIGLSGLQVLAAQAQIDEDCADATVHALIAGRGGQAFYQAFNGMDQNGLPHARGLPINQDIDIIASRIEAAPGRVVGSGRALLVQAGFDKAAGKAIPAGDMFIDPVQLGLRAWALDPEHFSPEPLYLRDADAKKAVPILPIDTTG